MNSQNRIFMHYHNVIQEISESAHADIRAEAVIADLMEHGMYVSDFVVHHKGVLKRRYSHDISHVQTLKLERFQEIIGIFLNRDGLYDSLPEGLFHQKTGIVGSESGKMSADSKVLKQEEKAARNFFLPFENEVFYQRVLLELEERKILGSFNENIFSNLYPHLWNLHPSIKREYIFRMILMLHLSYKVVGNYQLTALCLERILNEPVEARLIRNKFTKYGSNIDKNEYAESTLGVGSLGVNTVCGNSIGSTVTCVEFVIGPLHHTKPEEFLHDAPVERFLKCFYGYFIPAEMDVQTTVKVEKKKLNFTITEKEEGLVLGYETAI